MKCAKKRLIISHANVVSFVSVIHAAVVGIIVLVTTNLAIILGTTAMKILGIRTCRITQTVKMNTALHLRTEKVTLLKELKVLPSYIVTFLPCGLKYS